MEAIVEDGRRLIGEIWDGNCVKEMLRGGPLLTNLPPALVLNPCREARQLPRRRCQERYCPRPRPAPPRIQQSVGQGPTPRRSPRCARKMVQQGGRAEDY